jgi:hypothetical protein
MPPFPALSVKSTTVDVIPYVQNVQIVAIDWRKAVIVVYRENAPPGVSFQDLSRPYGNARGQVSEYGKYSPDLK